MEELLKFYRDFASDFGIEGWLAQIGSLAFILFTLFKGLKFVQEGERGLIMRFGKVRRNRAGEPKIKEPGFLIMIPYVDSLRKRHVRQQVIPLDEQVVTLKSGLSFRVGGVWYGRVDDVYKALFDINNLDISVKELCMGALRDAVAGHDDHADLADTATIAGVVRDDVSETTGTWGVKTGKFKITVCAPTPESAVIINLQAAAKRKREIIEEAATSLEVSRADLISSGYAAILAGVPLVANAGVDGFSSSVRKHKKLPKPEHDQSSFKFESAT